MRFLVSLFLTLVFYFLILFFLYSIFFQKSVKKKEVLIHRAIIVPKIIKKKSIKQEVKKEVKVKKAPKKAKEGSKKNITTGGKVDFNDIFKNVNYSVPTKKVNIQKQSILSRYKANNILKRLKKVKNINVNISFKTSSNLKKENLDKIVEKIGNVWYEISDIAGEYATIKFINKNGRVYVSILDTNLDPAKENILLERLKRIKFNKNIDLVIKFQTKASR